jgi:hypothetical protein
MAKAAKPGAKRAKYRAQIEQRLSAMGFKSHRYQWQASPSRLVVIVDDAMRDYALHAGQSKARTEYELGRLDTWAEVLNLKQLPVMERIEPAPVRVPVKRARKVDPAQIDLERLIAAQTKPNGAAHVSG